MIAERLTKNSIRCTHCNDVITSVTRHDFVCCTCRRVAVDGGLDYAKRLFTTPSDFEELSEYA